MPFYSKDWRSPGEEWVKTDEGWEKKKVLECLGQMSSTKNTNQNDDGTLKTETVPPHCHITIKCTREIAGFNGLGEVVKRLDFLNAVRDARRFNYVCALLHLLVGQQLTAMSGTAQKALIAMVEEVAQHVSTSQQNLRTLRQLAQGLHEARICPRSVCWGGPVGSQKLWRHNARAIQKILDTAAQLKIQEPSPDLQPTISELPEECIREILLRINDVRDLEACTMVGSPLSGPAIENKPWRELATAHYTPQQRSSVTERPHWKDTYHVLKRTFGVRGCDDYAETLALCRRCRCLFWRSLGHPCVVASQTELAPHHPVQPKDFLKFFSL